MGWGFYRLSKVKAFSLGAAVFHEHQYHTMDYLSIGDLGQLGVWTTEC